MELILIAAQSVDGFITRHDTPGSAFTSPEDKTHFINSLKEFDCRVMGATSYRQTRDGTRRSAANGRFHAILTRNPAAYAAEALPGQLEFTSETPHALVKRLADAGHRRCALLGGSQIHHLFLQAGLVHELWLTIEPVLFGTGTPLISGTCDVRLTLRARESLSPDTLLLRYAVLKP